MALTSAIFIYQGYLSDQSRDASLRILSSLNATEIAKLDPKMNYPEPPADMQDLFMKVTLIETVLWLFCFLLLLIFVGVARKSFLKYLKEFVEPRIRIEEEEEAAGFSGGGGFDEQLGRSYYNGEVIVKPSKVVVNVYPSTKFKMGRDQESMMDTNSLKTLQESPTITNNNGNVIVIIKNQFTTVTNV
ncbi:hypothetical protein HDU76_007116 [Blyttiomyces sp. JEL0837]|nr:hypothetical protein HDU76_007116 [Blyttiomyces sp. JEL0837]